jgi:tetratricopeptide (TPR) repeat protein
MDVPNDEVPLCENCHKRQSVKELSCQGHTFPVCARCFDRLSVQEALEAELVQIIDLGSAGRFEEALGLLDAVLKANRARDHDGWLAGSVADLRASIFVKAGQYARAEEAYRDWERTGFADICNRQLHALGLAKTLEAQGRDREAVAVLENALGNEEPTDLPLALTILTEVVRLSDKLGRPVDSKWLSIAEAAAGCYEVEMPVRDSPGEAILALKEITRGMQPTRLMGDS